MKEETGRLVLRDRLASTQRRKPSTIYAPCSVFSLIVSSTTKLARPDYYPVKLLVVAVGYSILKPSLLLRLGENLK